MKLFCLTIGLSLFLFSCQSGLSEKEIEKYSQQGDEIVQSAGKRLSSTLMTKIEESGISGAVGFCNLSALPITKEISANYGVEIKRTSLKIRNPKNRPSGEEVSVLNDFEERLNKGDALKPVVNLDREGRPHYYAPILAQKKCLMCHGELGKNLSVPVDSIIKSRYPEDLATGYREGELRGIWSVTFEPEKP